MEKKCEDFQTYCEFSMYGLSTKAQKWLYKKIKM